MTTHEVFETTRHAYPPKLRTLTVSQIEELSPTMRRFILTGAELEAEFPFARLTTATHVKIVVPQSTGEVILPELGDRGLAPATVPLDVRDYTVRSFDAKARALTLDFVLHEHGPAGRWAIHASPGDRLGVLGPRGYLSYPSSYGRYVLGADETGFPALERWLEEAPRQARIDAYLAASEAGRRTLPGHPGARLHWIGPVSGAEIAQALIESAAANDGATYVWAAAESSMVAPLRQHLRSTDFPRAAYDVAGYWRIAGAGEDTRPHGPRS